ncbi:hypothetical protein B0H21DRAFT_825010 [Amylocystis lapponica]|nr:hypothetical protein B0H21DRAFT_825010 [Amylocystis lapponica]
MSQVVRIFLLTHLDDVIERYGIYTARARGSNNLALRVFRKTMDTEDVQNMAKFYDKIHRDLPVDEFLRHVWNFEVNDYPTQGPKIKTFVPDPTAVRLYNQAPDGKSCYPHHANITRTLLNHLFSAPNVSPEQSTVVQNHSAVVREHMPPKPALTWNTKVWSQIRLWKWLPLYTEVTTERATKIAGDKDFRRFLQGNNAAVTSQQTGEKRKFSASDSNDVEPSTKRRKVLDLSSTEARAAMHLSEMLAQGIHSFASGFLVRSRNMQLWYADRMGLVQSCTFDWQLRPDLMALVYAAVGTANLAQLGIIPFLEFPPMSQKFKNYAGARIVLPGNEVVIGDGQERLSENMVFKIDATRKVWADSSAVGRGTTIVPVEAIGAAAERSGREALVAKIAWPDARCTAEGRLICIVRGQLQQKAPNYLRHIVDLKCFVTRNMEEMGLPRAFMDIELAEDDRREFRLMVLKKYEELQFVKGVGEFKTVFEYVVRAHHWALTTSGVLHRDISAGNIMFYRDAEEHVVGMLCDWDLAGEQLSDAEYEEDDDRMFRVRPVPKDVPTTATDAQDDVVLTMNQQDDTFQTIKVPGQAIPEKRPPRPRYRAGTGPFIALDMLLEAEPPLHHYRHELESFFFLLSYVCAVFDPEKHKFGPFSAWEQGNLAGVATAKLAFYMNWQSFKSSFDHTHEDFGSLVDEWVMPLWELFSSAARMRRDIDALVRSRDRHASKGMNGMVAKLDVEIGLLVTAWRKTITYETFMDCLGLPLHLSTDPTCPSCDVPVSSCSRQV